MTDNRAIVKTSYGKIEGSFENGMYVFKGIPYAEQPVGDLRWLPPQPLKKWNDVKPAKKYGYISPQNMMPMAANMPGMPDMSVEIQNEGCLYMNIWTPGSG